MKPKDLLLLSTLLLLLVFSLTSALAAPMSVVYCARYDGGASCGVAAAGNRVYAGIGYSLVVFDVSTRNNPLVMGQTATMAGASKSVAVSGNYAYMARDVTGLHIIDVSNPAAPVRVGGYDTTGNAVDVAVAGSYAYVADGYSGLQIISVSNPAAPTRVGGYDTSGYARGVAVSGSYAYVADDTAGLQVIDISNPAAPVRAANRSVTIGGTTVNAYRVAVSGNYVYVTGSYSYPEQYGGFTGGVASFDVSNPSSPVKTCDWSMSSNYMHFLYPQDVAVDGYYVYVPGYLYISETDSPLAVVERSNPGLMYSVAYYSGYTYGRIPNEIAVLGNYMYVTDDNGLAAFYTMGTPGPGIRAAIPNSGPNTGPLSVDIDGAAFQPGATVTFSKEGGYSIAGTGVTVVNRNRLTANFDLTRAPAGSWHMKVLNPDGQFAYRSYSFRVSEVVPPVINSVSVSPSRAASGDTVGLSANVTDNYGVSRVTANGIELGYVSGSGGTWTGSIPADAVLGQHAVTVVATDAWYNTATDATHSYTTAQVLLAVNRSLAGDVWAEAASTYLFGTIGKVISVSGSTFDIEDGSGMPIRVSYPGHGLLVNDYAIAHGAWDLIASPQVLNATRVTKL